MVKKVRVVSGKYKGCPLKAVPGNSTRPTTDKVKEAIFNIMGPYFEGGIALDLFAGSGGLGIEGLSRGLDKVIFVDQDKKAISTIYDNLKTCKISEEVEVYRNDSFRAAKALAKRGLQVDFLFLDPPYAKQELVKLITFFIENNLLKSTSVILCEHDKSVQLPDTIGPLYRRKFEIYGIVAISIYEFSNDSELV